MNLFKVYGTRQRNVSECVWVTAFTDLVTFIEKMYNGKFLFSGCGLGVCEMFCLII